jgi:hypothetical protein
MVAGHFDTEGDQSREDTGGVKLSGEQLDALEDLLSRRMDMQYWLFAMWQNRDKRSEIAEQFYETWTKHRREFESWWLLVKNVFGGTQ